jgi:NAD(P)H dehydrogenase (quinone)
MNVLVVFAHPEPKSLNGTLKEVAVDTLTDEGHQVQVSDLYAMNWKAVLDEDDFTERMNPEIFNPIMEQLNAMEKGRLPQDISIEMDKILWADLIIFQFPIWWSNFPAILKGWVDRVFFNGFAFNLTEMKLYDNGPFNGKKAMLSFTTGAPRELYSAQGPHGEIEVLINYFNHVIFEFVGMEALPYFGVFGPGDLSGEELEQELDKYKELLMDIK